MFYVFHNPPIHIEESAHDIVFYTVSARAEPIVSQLRYKHKNVLLHDGQ